MNAFILVQVANDEWLPWLQWRATRVTPEKTTDVFFFALSREAAKAHLVKHHPGATFSDEVRP